MLHPTDVIKNIRQTEKGSRIASHDQYILSVASAANKTQIRQAVEQLFGVQVTGVNTILCHGKWRRLQAHWGRRSDWKKAIVTLAKGQKIELKA